MDIRNSLSQGMIYARKFSQQYLPASLQSVGWNGYRVVYYTVGVGATALLVYLIFLISRLVCRIFYSSHTIDSQSMCVEIPSPKVNWVKTFIQPVGSDLNKRGLPKCLSEELGKGVFEYPESVVNFLTWERLEAIGLFVRENALQHLQGCIKNLKREIDTLEDSLKECEFKGYHHRIAQLEGVHRNLLLDIRQKQKKRYSDLLEILSQIPRLQCQDKDSFESISKTHAVKKTADELELLDDMGRDLNGLEMFFALLDFSIQEKLKAEVKMPELYQRLKLFLNKLHQFMQSDSNTVKELKISLESKNFELRPFLNHSLKELKELLPLRIGTDKEHKAASLKVYFFQTELKSLRESIHDVHGKTNS